MHFYAKGFVCFFLDFVGNWQGGLLAVFLEGLPDATAGPSCLTFLFIDLIRQSPSRISVPNIHLFIWVGFKST